MASFAAYNRLGLHVSASNREVVRAALRLLRRESRYGPKHRAPRQEFLRELIQHHHGARDLYLRVNSGRL